jgi:late competence protein required for DNA uptake (superfamily II DNA/RNA helicase)
MFKCERCGSGYNANYIGVESCPRCLLLDRVQAPLSFKMFRMNESRAESLGQAALPSESPEAASPPPARSAP